MGGLSDFFLGSEGSTETIKTDNMSQEQMDVLKKLSGKVSDNIGVGGPVYDGQMSAGASDLQNQTFGNIDEILAGGLNTGQSVNALGRSNVDQITAPGEDMNAVRDTWEQSWLEPAQRQFSEEISPQIMQMFAGQNASDSRALNAELSRAGGNMNKDLQGMLMQMMDKERTTANAYDFEAQNINSGRNYQADEANADRNLSAQGMELDRLFNIPGLQTQFASLGLTAGDQQRNINQGGLDENYAKWEMGQDYNNPWTQNYLNSVLGVKPYNIDTVVQPAGGGMLSGLFGGMGKGIGNGIGSGIAGMF